ncbi:hypothetical protein EAF00_003046 [Botryotinia globosa]|nr:hypothetical protein EAF00_003046 [Botryotinia globosa]
MNESFVIQLSRVTGAMLAILVTTFPMPPHHWLLGHIPLSASIIGSLPPYAHGVYVGDQIRQRYPHLDSALYLDNWPLAAPILVVLKPDMMYQLIQANQIPKDKSIRAFLKPLTGESDLVTLEGDTWKYWRAIFNPGFSAGYVSNGKMMFLEDASLNPTIDIIELDKRDRSIKDSEIQKKDKSIVNLALKAYLAENPSAAGIEKSFQNFAMAQIKLFIFAGHDTTSAGAIFTYHLLSQHPNVLEKVRAEHTEVLGANIADAESVIASKPQLLNQFTYTIAVIKESLRIYPTVAALRDRQSYFSLIGDNGLRFPTERIIVWGGHYATHHNPAHWSRAEEFLPERWIVTEDYELYPPKNGWRPFERGPRNFIGQEVAMTEIKLMLALTIRDFDFKDAYEGGV